LLFAWTPAKAAFFGFIRSQTSGSSASLIGSNACKPLFNRRHRTKRQQVARAGPAVAESLDAVAGRKGPDRNDKQTLP
jgi:hypothetical protein